VEYFVFVISVCVLATVLTVVVLHLYLRAETHPVTPMPTWVGMELQTVTISTTALKIILQLITGAVNTSRFECLYQQLTNPNNFGTQNYFEETLRKSV